MFTSEYDLAMDGEPDCEACGRQLRWQECEWCKGHMGTWTNWDRTLWRICEACDGMGGEYKCGLCDVQRQPRPDPRQTVLF